MPDDHVPDPRRLKAWETRRAKYGKVGHAGPYRMGTAVSTVDNIGRMALTFVLQLHARGELSEGQCCRALRVDRVSFRELVDAKENSST